MAMAIATNARIANTMPAMAPGMGVGENYYQVMVHMNYHTHSIPVSAPNLRFRHAYTR